MRHTIAVIAVAFTSIATAQQWQLVDSGGPAMLVGGIAWDSARQQLLRHCGRQSAFTQELAQTSVFDGARWLPTDANPPGPLDGNNIGSGVTSNMLLAPDDARGLVLLHHGFTGQLWEWNGAGWRERTSAVHPPAGSAFAFAYDRARGRAVACTQTTSGTDTWEWDDTVWTATGAATPSIATATYSPQRGRVIALAGRDLHEWNGTTWAQVTTNLLPATTNASLAAYTLSFDSWRQRLVLVDTSPVTVTVRELNGITLTNTIAAPGPSRRFGASATFDPSRGVTVLCGGSAVPYADAGKSDTWAWDGSQWTELALAPSAGELAMVYDSTRNVLVATACSVQSFTASTTGTWERDGSGWRRVASTSPAAPGAMVFDSARNLTLFCSSLATGPRSWNGTTWSAALTTTQPPARFGFGLAFDAARSETVLFGGSAPTGTLLNDTWLFNGTAWRQATPANSPTPRETTMAFDPARNETVLFGGLVGTLRDRTLDDTWTWDGVTWTQRAPALRPAARHGHAMTFDAANNRIAMVGGTLRQPLGSGLSVIARLPAEPWSWDGTQWQDAPATLQLRDHAALAFDSQRNRLVMQGGYQAATTTPNASRVALATADTLEWNTTLSTATVLASGCTYPQTPLRGEFIPQVGTSRFALSLTGASSSTPAVFGFGQISATSIPVGNGCFLQLTGSIITAFVATNVGGAARLAVPVPARPALLGTILWSQAGYLDPGQLFRTSNLVLFHVGQ